MTNIIDNYKVHGNIIGNYKIHGNIIDNYKVHGKEDFTEIQAMLQKVFDILTISLNVLHNYFDSKLIFGSVSS